MPDRVTVTSADFVRQIGRWQNEALEHPISITHHGRERLVLVSSRRYEQALRAASDGDSIRDAANLLGIIEMRLDARGRIVSANAAFQRLTAFAHADLIGAPLADLAPPSDRLAAAKRLQRILSVRREETFPLSIARQSGAPLAFTAVCAPGPDETMLLVAAPLP